MMQSDLHHRSHEKLKNYWYELKKSRLYPQENELDPEYLTDIWDSCFLISNDDVTKRVGYRYSYLGRELVAAFGDDVTNQDAALKLLSTARVPNARKFDEVIDQRKPVFDEAEFTNLMGVHIRYRACLLPLGYNDKEVSHILGCMRWRAY
jgi:hypothetical protein